MPKFPGKAEDFRELAKKHGLDKEEAGKGKATAAANGRRKSAGACAWHVNRWHQILETGVCCVCV